MAQQRYNNEEHDRYLLGSPASSTSSANSSIQHLEDSDFFHDPTGFLVRLASRIENPSIQQELTSNPAADAYVSWCFVCRKEFKASSTKMLTTSIRSHEMSSRHIALAAVPANERAFCSHCNKGFLSGSGLNAHLESGVHSKVAPVLSPAQSSHTSSQCLGHEATPALPKPANRCYLCDRNFGSEIALAQHLRDKVHTEADLKPGFSCDDCGEKFKTRKGLKMHEKSVVHNKLFEEKIHCLGVQCRKKFQCPSAMFHHLESGGCRSGIDRPKLDAMMKEKDVGRIFTIFAEQFEIFSDYDSEDEGVPLFTPSSTPDRSRSSSFSESGFLMHTSPTATPQERESTCPYCPDRIFTSQEAFEQHMTSPVHAEEVYRCPKDIVGEEEAIRMFKAVSALAQHLESGACEGGMETFRVANERIMAMLRMAVVEEAMASASV